MYLLFNIIYFIYIFTCMELFFMKSSQIGVQLYIYTFKNKYYSKAIEFYRVIFTHKIVVLQFTIVILSQ